MVWENRGGGGLDLMDNPYRPSCKDTISEPLFGIMTTRFVFFWFLGVFFTWKSKDKRRERERHEMWDIYICKVLSYWGQTEGILRDKDRFASGYMKCILYIYIICFVGCGVIYVRMVVFVIFDENMQNCWQWNVIR